MLKCNCGFENSEGSLFCSACGQKLSAVCPSCGKTIPAGSRFCSFCGYNMEGGKSQSSQDGGNVIAGDVTGSYNTNYNTSVVNNIYNQVVETDEKCAYCGALIPAAAKKVFQCSKCGKFYCAAHLDMNTHTCVYCTEKAKSRSVDDGISGLKSGRYDVALRSFEDGISNDPQEADFYYFASIALLDGKKAFVQKRDVIDKIINYMNKAISIESKGIYYYFLAYIKYDYFERKYLNSSPNYKMMLSKAISLGVKGSEVSEMYSLLKVPRPDVL